MTRPIIEVRDLSKVYQLGNIGATRFREEIVRLWGTMRGNGEARKNGHFWALRDVSFEVQPGEVVGIIGRNGAGKSTLLKILSRITQQTSGEITLRGRVASLLEVGTGFHPDLTGRENIFLNGAILGMKKAEIRSKFDEIVAFAGIEKFIDTPVKRYSSGMYVRLAFGVAAHLDPEILIVDEVLAVGDAEFQKKCLRKMQDVSDKAGRTIIFVSHNIAAVRTLCARAILFREGKIIWDGSTDMAIDHYYEMIAPKHASNEIPDSRHLYNTGEMFIRSLTILNETGEPTLKLRMGETFRLNICFELIASISEVRIGIGINTADGIRIASMHNTDSGSTPFQGTPGIYELTFTMENYLKTGTYTISAGANRGLGYETIDYVPDVFQFQVSEASKHDAIQDPQFPGFVRFDGVWSTPKLVIKQTQT
jgi:lipopolysaccharide transport system ATP-binding protein